MSTGRDWDETILNEIKRQNLTPEDVERLNFVEICTLAKIDHKNKPPEFFYETIRQRIVNKLRDIKKNADQETLRAALEQTLKNSILFSGATIKIDEWGEFIIDKKSISSVSGEAI